MGEFTPPLFLSPLDEICVPSEDERFECSGEESWDWDASTRTLANGLRNTMRSFGHIFCFVCAMDMLEPMRPLVSALQGRLDCRRSLFWLQKSGGGHEFLY